MQPGVRQEGSSEWEAWEANIEASLRVHAALYWPVCSQEPLGHGEEPPRSLPSGFVKPQLGLHANLELGEAWREPKQQLPSGSLLAPPASFRLLSG